MLLSYYVDDRYVVCHICSSNAECHFDESCVIMLSVVGLIVMAPRVGNVILEDPY